MSVQPVYSTFTLSAETDACQVPQKRKGVSVCAKRKVATGVVMDFVRILGITLQERNIGHVTTVISLGHFTESDSFCWGGATSSSPL